MSSTTWSSPTASCATAPRGRGTLVALPRRSPDCPCLFAAVNSAARSHVLPKASAPSSWMTQLNWLPAPTCCTGRGYSLTPTWSAPASSRASPSPPHASRPTPATSDAPSRVVHASSACDADARTCSMRATGTPTSVSSGAWRRDALASGPNRPTYHSAWRPSGGAGTEAQRVADSARARAGGRSGAPRGTRARSAGAHARGIIARAAQTNGQREIGRRAARQNPKWRMPMRKFGASWAAKGGIGAPSSAFCRQGGNLNPTEKRRGFGQQYR